MTFVLIGIGIYVVMIAIYVLAVTVILRRILNPHSKRKEDDDEDN